MMFLRDSDAPFHCRVLVDFAMCKPAIHVPVCVLYVYYYIQFLNVLHNRTHCRSPIRIWYATWGLVRTSLPVCLPLIKVVILSYLYRIPAFHNYIHDWKPSIRNYYEIRYVVHYYVHKCIYYRNSVWSIRQVAMLRSVVVMIIVNFTTWRPLKLYSNLYFKSMSVGRYSVTPLSFRNYKVHLFLFMQWLTILS